VRFHESIGQRAYGYGDAPEQGVVECLREQVELVFGRRLCRRWYLFNLASRLVYKRQAAINFDR
jgi:hypothetical protein